MTSARDLLISHYRKVHPGTSPMWRVDVVDDILAALEAAGKKVVDREPTLEMIDAARTAYFGCGGVCNPKPWWCAMWDAAERRKEP